MLLCRPAGDAPIHLVQLRPPVAQPNPVRSPWGCLSCVLGSTPSCRRYRLLVWPGACLDLAVHLHELSVFQAFFANENSFRLKKTLFIKKKKKNQVISPTCGSVLGRAGKGDGQGQEPQPQRWGCSWNSCCQSQGRKVLSMETSWKLGGAMASLSKSKSKLPLPQEDVTICLLELIAKEIKYLWLLSLASRFKPW